MSLRKTALTCVLGLLKELFSSFLLLKITLSILDARYKLELSFLQTLRHVSLWVRVTHEINEHQSPTKINDSTVFWSPFNVFIYFSTGSILFHWINSNKTWHKASFGQGDSSLYLWRRFPLPRGDDTLPKLKNLLLQNQSKINAVLEHP